MSGLYGMPAGRAAALWWALHRPRWSGLLMVVPVGVLGLFGHASWWYTVPLVLVAVGFFASTAEAGAFGLTPRDSLVGDLIGLALGAVVALLIAWVALAAGAFMRGAGPGVPGAFLWRSAVVVGLTTLGTAVLYIVSARRSGIRRATSVLPGAASGGSGGGSRRARGAASGSGRAAGGGAGWSRGVWSRVWPDTAEHQIIHARATGTILGGWASYTALFCAVVPLRMIWPDASVSSAVGVSAGMLVVLLITMAGSLGSSFAMWVALQGSRARWARSAFVWVAAAGALLGPATLIPLGLDYALAAWRGYEPVTTAGDLLPTVLVASALGAVLALLALVAGVAPDRRGVLPVLAYVVTCAVLVGIGAGVGMSFAEVGVGAGLAATAGVTLTLALLFWLVIRRIALRRAPNVADYFGLTA